MAERLRKPHFPPNLVKYPNPLDEPWLEMVVRTGMRPPDPGEDPITWAQNQPDLRVYPRK